MNNARRQFALQPPVRPPRFAWGLAIAFIALATLAACVPPVGKSEAALALEDIAAGVLPSRLKNQTSQPTRRTLTYEVEGRSYSGDLYLPADGAKAGIVLVPGVVPAGKDDRRLVALARTLARLRFAVLVPDLGELRRYRVRANNVREVADAFRHLKDRPELPAQGRTGIAGFSYGAGPVVLAAVQQDIRDEVGFVVALGGYYDLRTIVTYFTTGYYRHGKGETWQRLDPHPYAKWVFTLSNTDLLERAGDRAALRSYAAEMMMDENLAIASTSPTGLGPDARNFLTLLENTDPNRVPTLIEQLSPRILAELNGIDPAAHDLSGMHAHVILVHGRRDNIIPYTESITLAQALPPGRAHLFLIEGFAHVDMALEREDIPQMLRAMEQLLAQRDTPASRGPAGRKQDVQDPEPRQR